MSIKEWVFCPLPRDVSLEELATEDNCYPAV
jgi:hypothetical protein